MKSLFAVVLVCFLAGCAVTSQTMRSLYHVEGLRPGAQLQVLGNTSHPADKVLGGEDGTHCFTQTAMPPGHYFIAEAHKESHPFGGIRLLRLPEWMRPVSVSLMVELTLRKIEGGEAILVCHRDYSVAQGARYPNIEDMRMALRGVAVLN